MSVAFIIANHPIRRQHKTCPAAAPPKPARAEQPTTTFLPMQIFPRTLAGATTMPDLRANEREFASKVYQWMASAFARGGHPFESVSGETSIKVGGKTLFLDGAIWLNRAANLAFSNFELKTPDTDVRDSELLKNAAEEARALHADYFVTWNMRDTIVWRVPHEGELFTNSLVAYDKFPPLTQIAELIPQDLKLYPLERWQNVARLAGQIESAHKQKEVCEPAPGLRTFEDENFRIRMKSQSDLLTEVEAEGKTVKWGQLIRAPDAYFTVLEKCNQQKTPLIKLEAVAPVQRGITTNDVEFFFLDDETQKHWKIEKKFLVSPVVYTPKEVPDIVIKRKNLKQALFKCDLPKKRLAGTNALRYIQNHERGKRNLTGDWYLLRDIIQEAGCVLHARHGDTFRVPLNNKGFALNDNLYHITPEKSSHVRLLCAALNSAWFTLNIELSGRLNLGDGALKLQVFEVSDILIPDLRKFSAEEKNRILAAFNKLAKRKILPYAEEIKQKDRRELDRAVFRAMGLENDDADACELAALELITERHSIAALRSKQSKARVERDTGKILAEVVEEILPDGARHFPEAFWPQGFNERKPNAFKEVNVTGKRLRLGHAMLMQQEIVDQDGQVITCPSRAEAEFLIFAAKPDSYIVRLPADKFIVEKTVASYLRYLDGLEKQFLRKFGERTLNHAEAETLTRRALETLSPFFTSG